MKQSKKDEAFELILGFLEDEGRLPTTKEMIKEFRPYLGLMNGGMCKNIMSDFLKEVNPFDLERIMYMQRQDNAHFYAMVAILAAVSTFIGVAILIFTK